MGFYSIYKIIKDVIRTLFGNKFLKLFIVASIIFTIIFILGEKGVFATDITINNNTYTTSTFFDENIATKNYTIFYQYSTSKYLLIASETPLLANLISGTNYHFYTSGSYYYAPTAWTLNLQEIFNTSTYYFNNYTFSRDTDTSNIIYTNHDIKNSNGDIVVNSSIPSALPPSLSNTSTQLENLSFNNFIINANSFTNTMIENPDEPLVMLFYNRSLSNPNNTDGLYPIKEKYFYKESIYFDTNNSTDDNYIFNYPIFKTGIFFNIGSTYEIKFAKRVYIEEYDTYGYDYFDTNYVFTISSNVTQDYINQLNQQTATSTDEDNQDELNNSIQQQTQSIDNINNTITDSNVDTSSINLPTDNTTDPTQSGVDNIFQTIYNSFTSGTAQDIVFPIPNTNKNITLPANYTYNSLNNNNASWVINIIQAFYWYIISRYIIVDIMQKIRKIKQGNLDNIENSNIKEDML